MHFKRKKCKRVVRCTLCTPVRWFGNRKGRFDERAMAKWKAMREES